MATSVPVRFPWKFVVGFFALATLVILVVGAFTEPGETLPIDNIIRVGSCVDVDRQIQEAWEVSCDGPHDSQVVRMVPFDGRCPADTETFRDRQGLGLVCVVS
jgi:molecular chaperone DnaJ